MQLEGRRGTIGNQSVLVMTNMKQTEITLTLISIRCNVYISVELNQICSRIFEFSLICLILIE